MELEVPIIDHSSSGRLTMHVNNRQNLHLSQAKRCSDEAGYLCCGLTLFNLQVYAARRTMPNGLVFPRNGFELDVIGSA